jgi:hypothetical protein
VTGKIPKIWTQKAYTPLKRVSILYSNRTLKHLLQYSTLIPSQLKSRLSNAPIDQLRHSIEETPGYLSEFPEFLSGQKKLKIPVYAVWGACEDVTVLEKFRSKEYSITNLNIIDEATTHLLEIGGVSLRLFGLGGAVVQHKLFDCGEGKWFAYLKRWYFPYLLDMDGCAGLDTIAGGSGTMWTTALQIGELVETAQSVRGKKSLMTFEHQF